MYYDLSMLELRKSLNLFNEVVLVRPGALILDSRRLTL